jgi:hypothetical protein
VAIPRVGERSPVRGRQSREAKGRSASLNHRVIDDVLHLLTVVFSQTAGHASVCAFGLSRDRLCRWGTLGVNLDVFGRNPESRGQNVEDNRQPADNRRR